MAKKSSIQKNMHRSQLIKRHALKREKLKKLVMNRQLSAEERFKVSLKLAQMPRNGAVSRYRNRCVETGRARGFFRFFGLSRIRLLELASEGKIPGMIHSSW